MKKFTLFILLLCFFHTLLFALENKNVLIINSYHRGFQWSDKVITGIEKVLYNTNININVLYMDSKRIASAEYYKELKELYQVQLKKANYDLIVALDKFSYEFSLQNYKELFKDEPLYFIGIEQYSKEDVKKYGLEKKVSGLLEKRAIKETVNIIQKLIPKLKKLYIINDASKNGKDSDPFIQKLIQQKKENIDIEYIRESTLNELSKKFSKYRKNEAILFVRFYNDRHGKLYKNSEIANFINNSNLPVFTTDTLFIGKGSAGGKLVNVNHLGLDAGKDILSILNKDIKMPFIKKEDYYELIFDYKKAQKFQLNLKNLKDKFVYVNFPKSFFDRYRKFIDTVFIISPFLLLLIFGLIHNLILKIRSSKILQQRIELDKILLNAIKSPIVWQDERGKIVTSNTKFNEFMKLKEVNNLEIAKSLEEAENSSIKELLKPLINKKLGNNELIIKNNHNKEKIYLIHQTDYIENIYKTSGTVTVLTDITKERQAIAEKAKHQEFIIQQSKLAEIGEIFSSIAHQWKSPLVEIATIAQEQIFNAEGEIDEVNNKYVNDIMIQVRYMTETINNFQKFIMPSTKKSVFDISESVYEMLEIIRHNMKYNYINVNVEVAPKTNLMILGYKNELMQTLLNIVNNAKDSIIKKRAKSKIKKGEILISIKNINQCIQIEIEDNGEGIPKENLNLIFEPYFTTKVNGHGIGLYMAKLIIEDKIGGEIKAKNTAQGAKFIIRMESFNENISS
jgi:signal transduction histidine kinase/ABC-type uncharacterized transport system substrate-binding protein